MSHTQTNAKSNDALVGAAFVLVSAIAFSAKVIFIKLDYASSVDAITRRNCLCCATPFFMVLAGVLTITLTKTKEG